MLSKHRYQHSVMSATALVVWWSVVVSVAGGTRPQGVIISRCCPVGHELGEKALVETELSREAAAAACVRVPMEVMWTPRVYAPARAAYLERGRLPAHWQLQYGVLPECPELRVLPEHAAPYALLANNGSLLLRAPAALLPVTRYCADANAALVCLEDARGPSVSMCCAEGQAFDGARCVTDEVRSAAAVSELRSVAGAAGGVALQVSRGWPSCAAGPHYAEIGMLSAGSLSSQGSFELGTTTLGTGAWCVDAGAGGARVLACAADSRADGHAPQHALYGAGLAVGALFLAATLAASLALPAAHHALHWRCQTHYVAALMLGDTLLAVTQLAADALPPTLCRAIAVCMHFLFLSAFFWLNTMCFNIWWTFRDFRPTSLERGQELWRLRVYGVYAWGGPLALAGTAALLDAAGAPHLLRPRFGERRCWFYGDLEILVYFFGPVGVLLLVNVALFASTTRQLTCGLWRRDEVKASTERAALGRVCAKLVVVMGVPWALDVISWAAGGPPYVWYATDLLNALQGLLIFLVVGCQPHAWAALKGLAARCACLRPDRRNSTSHLPSCGESLTHTTPAPEPSAPSNPSATTNPTAPTAPAANKLPMETVC